MNVAQVTIKSLLEIIRGSGRPPLRCTSWLLAAALLAMAACTPSSSSAQKVQWLTEQQFRVQLRAPAEYSWTQKPARGVFQALGEHHRIAIVLDRRIAPDQVIPGSTRDAPLDTLLMALADHLKIGVSYLGPVVYYGPLSTSQKLATVSALRVDDLKKMPPDRRAALLRSRPWQWRMLDEPRQLLNEVAEDAELSVKNPEAVPHDLWPEQAFPPLNTIDRLLLILAGFDLSFEFVDDGRAIEIVPMPTEVTLTREYTLPKSAAETSASLRKKFPDAEFRLRGQTAVASASAEVHRLLSDFFAGRRVSRRTVGTDVKTPSNLDELQITLNVQNKPVETVINYLAKQLKFEVEFADVSDSKKNQLISFMAKDETLDQVLKKILDPVMLTFQRRGNTVVVAPPP